MRYPFSDKIKEVFEPGAPSLEFIQNLIWDYIASRGEIKTVSAGISFGEGFFYHPSLTEEHGKAINEILERIYCPE